MYKGPRYFVILRCPARDPSLPISSSAQTEQGEARQARQGSRPARTETQQLLGRGCLKPRIDVVTRRQSVLSLPSSPLPSPWPPSASCFPCPRHVGHPPGCRHLSPSPLPHSVGDLPPPLLSPAISCHARHPNQSDKSRMSEAVITPAPSALSHAFLSLQLEIKKNTIQPHCLTAKRVPTLLLSLSHLLNLQTPLQLGHFVIPASPIAISVNPDLSFTPAPSWSSESPAGVRKRPTTFVLNQARSRPS